MKQQTIAILMATYNGQQYLSTQIDSILRQTNHQWHLFIHDDGSVDDTLHIVKNYAMTHPQQITMMDYPPRGGAFHNFMSMLEKTDADYYMFCDQDDIWHKDKIACSMQVMTQTEDKHPGLPVVVHTDLRLVDENGSTLANSFWQEADMHPDMFHSFAQRISNVVTGCTMLFNKAARDGALSRTPNGHPLHDEWVAIRTCAEGGKVVPLFEQTIDYRQHAGNTLGAEACYNRKTLKYYLTNLRRIIQENKENYRVLRSAGYGTPTIYLYNKVRNTIVYHLKY